VQVILVLNNNVSFPRKQESRIGLFGFHSELWVPAFAGMTTLFAFSVSATAQTVTVDQFADGANGAKLHAASGFVCPPRIGAFERDALEIGKPH
jgi:hypothetical protein